MPILLFILAVVLLIAGLAITFDVFAPLRARRYEKELKKRKTKHGKKNIASTVEYYSGKRDFIMIREINEARKTLDETNRSSEFTRLCFQCLLFTGAGALIGIAMRNIPATAILGVAGFMFPLLRLKLYKNKYEKYMTAQLESTTSLITISYIRCNSFIQAVEENIDQISPIVRPKFQRFLDECNVNPSVKSCVRNLKNSINNLLFKEWCDVVLRTIDNSEMKEALLPICEKYTTIKIVQDEIDTEVMGSMMEYIVMVLFMICVYPLVYILNKDWFAYYSTGFGKIVVSYTMAITLFAVIKMISILKPVEFDR